MVPDVLKLNYEIMKVNLRIRWGRQRYDPALGDKILRGVPGEAHWI